MKKATALVLALVISLSFALSAFAANPVEATEEWKNEFPGRFETAGKVLVMPGAKENDIKFRWFSSNALASFVFCDSEGNENTASCSTSLTKAGFGHTVSLTGLTPGNYTYRVTADGKDYEGEFSVRDDTGSFTAAYISDVQIGRSGSNSDEAVENDTYGWHRTVGAISGKGAELIIDGGDNANKSSSGAQYCAFMSAPQLKNIRLASTVGNHDSSGRLYTNWYGASGREYLGNDYWFCYGNTLFIVIDSNVISKLFHTSTVNAAVAEFPNTAWRVAVMHHSPYSPDADEISNITNGKYLTDIFDKYSIDLVLSGHDHCYARTCKLTGGEENAAGTTYFEVNSASACNVRNFDISEYSYLDFTYELHEESYSILTFSDDSIEISSYLTDSDECFDSFTIMKDASDTDAVTMGILEKIAAFFYKISGLLDRSC